ncbi:transporter substrate-binding domain-containing protein [Saccharophagus degradans]|uniref:Transporter substrate-binding domain-containing protein n=1 Tax=Saccharophagus degradans TaxID=86304 RepID=A0AAW7X7T5_9GAMM|nr:transporter substrate-binding domain-containing protein [Saccharophagus degradans]MDO6423534.1 transporter substrate-binding domain-containing protein [Saccharophagus degradans]MDO6607794.1 transporter substrate-binding domain-containing protein [Saccharophagus degradans]
MKYLFRILTTVACLLTAIYTHGESIDITINKPRSNSTYMLDLMKLALSYSDKHYNFLETSETLTRSAQVEALRNGELTVMWGGTSDQMEQDFTPVRIDGYRGLMSWRFFIIREGEQHRFDSIYSANDLKQFKFGQGKTWQDGNILQQAGFNVVRTVKKEGLFYMLDGDRFDAFPRGATEAWEEVAKYKQLPLTVENKLVLSYTLPTYFFVNKNHPQLAAAIEQGLERAIADGQFDDYFYNNDRVREFLKRAQLDKRRVIKITNPFLPKSTPLDREELWLDLSELAEGAKNYGL